jgi:hypothetical protein
MNAVPSPVYAPGHFVNREEEIGRVLRKVERLLRGLSSTPPHTAFHGPRGSGKSWLLHRLRDVLAEKFGNQITLLFFSLNPSNPALVEDVLRTACHELGLSTTPPAATLDDLNQWLVDLCKRHRRPIVILVDELDKVEPEPLKALENYFILPLCPIPRLLLVLGSRVPRPRGRLGDVELKRRTENVELPPFDAARTREQIAALGYNADLAPHILAIGGGYPMSNAILAAGWTTDPGKALQDCAGALLDGVDGYLRPYFWALCPLDSIDVDRMAPLLAEYFGDPLENWDRQRCHRILMDMVSTRLVQWGRWTPSGYGMDPAVRQVLRSAMQRDQPERWDKLSQIVLKQVLG